MLGGWLDKRTIFPGAGEASRSGDPFFREASQADSVSSTSEGRRNWAEAFRLDHADLIGPDRQGPRLWSSLYWLLAATAILSALVFGAIVETTQSVGAREARQVEDGRRLALQRAEDRIVAITLELNAEKEAAEISRSLLKRQIDDGRLALAAAETDLQRTQDDHQLQLALADDREHALQRLREQFETRSAEIAGLRAEVAEVSARADAASRAERAAEEARLVAENALLAVRGGPEGEASGVVELASVDPDPRIELDRSQGEALRPAAPMVSGTDKGLDATKAGPAPADAQVPRWLALGGPTFAALDATGPSRGKRSSTVRPKVPPSVGRRPQPNRSGLPAIVPAVPQTSEAAPTEAGRNQQKDDAPKPVRSRTAAPMTSALNGGEPMRIKLPNPK